MVDRGGLRGLFSLGLLLAAGLVAGRAAATEILFVLHSKGSERPSPVDVRLVVEPIAVGGEGMEDRRTIENAASVPGQLAVELPEGSRWQVGALAEGYWAEPRTFKVGAVAATFEIELLPAGEVEGSLVLPGGTPPPELLELRLLPAPDADKTLPEATELCPVTANRFRCRVPAGTFDLRLEAEGYVAHYRWGAEIPSGGRRNVGSLRLESGASIVGWVEAPEARFDFDACSVELAPLAAGYDRAPDRQRHRVRIQEGTVNDRGFFQLGGVSPGGYEIRVRHPDFAPARYGPVQVTPGSETELPPLTLSPPIHLTVEVGPPTDPYHQSWRARLHRRSSDPSYLDLVAEGAVSKEGVWRVRDLEPDSYWLTVLDSRGTVWERSEIATTPGEMVHPVTLPLERLEGLVTLGGEPLTGARVELSERRGGARNVASSDEEGRIYVFLPRGRSWDVKVTHRPLGVSTSFEDVTVPAKRAGEPWPKKEFVIPDTLIEGEVVDRHGRPLTVAAVVDVWRRDAEASQVTEDDGRFSLRGLEPGRVRLQARQEDPESGASRSSEQVAVEVLENGDAGDPVQLVLQDDPAIEGMVVSPTGQGVPGARVVAMLEFEPGRAPDDWWLPEGHTDLDGVFRLTVPPAVRTARLTVYPPGFAVTQQRVETSRQEPVIVPVETVGGTVVVSYEDPPVALRDRLKAETVLASAGTLGTTFALMDWANLHGAAATWDRLVLPMLEPGPYLACVGSAAVPYLASGAPPPPEVTATFCAGGELAPHGRLELRLPATATRALAESNGTSP